MLTGLALPAGGRHVELTFSSAPYETGKAITLAALALSTLALVGGLLVDRRRRA